MAISYEQAELSVIATANLRASGGKQEMMAKFPRQRVPYTLERLVYVVAGAVASAVVSAIVGDSLPRSELLMAAATVLLAIILAFFVGRSNQRIQGLADNLEATVRYVEELYLEAEGIKFKGLGFEHLAELVSEAQNEILAITISHSPGGRFSTSDTDSREQYLKSIEDRLRTYKNRGFRYERLIQISPEDRDVQLTDLIGTVLPKHIERVLIMKQNLRRESRKEDSNLDILFAKVYTQRFFSFLMVDGRYLVIEVDKPDSEGNMYGAGFLFLEDRTGKIINHFRGFFNTVKDQHADPITTAEIR